MANYENMSLNEVQRLARQGDGGALYEMAWRLEAIPPEIPKNDPAYNCAWQDYWWEKAADSGYARAKDRYARSLVNERLYDSEWRQKGMGYFESLVRDFDAGKLKGDLEIIGIVAKLQLGMMLCQGFGTRRDVAVGAKLLKEADSLTSGFDKFGFETLSKLAVTYGQGYIQVNGDPSIDDLRQAISLQRKANAAFDPQQNDPNNEGILGEAKEYLQLLLGWKETKESLRDSIAALGSALGFGGSSSSITSSERFKTNQERMTKVSPAAQQRIKIEKDALTHVRQCMARLGWSGNESPDNTSHKPPTGGHSPEQIRKSKYDNYIEEMRKASGWRDLESIAKGFKELGDYKDSRELASECIELARKAKEESYESLLQEYESLLQEKEKRETNRQYNRLSNAGDFQRLAREFRGFGSTYKDARALAAQCDEIARFEDALTEFNSMDDSANNCCNSSDFMRIAEEYQSIAKAFDAISTDEQAKGYARQCREKATEFISKSQAAHIAELITRFEKINDRTKDCRTSPDFKRMAGEYKSLAKDFEAISENEQAEGYARQCRDKVTEFRNKSQAAYFAELVTKFNETKEKTNEKTKDCRVPADFMRMSDEYISLKKSFNEISNYKTAKDYARQCEELIKYCDHAFACEGLILLYEKIDKEAENLNQIPKGNRKADDHKKMAEEYVSLIQSFEEIPNYEKARVYAGICNEKANLHYSISKNIKVSEITLSTAGRVLQIAVLAAFFYTLLGTRIIYEVLEKLPKTGVELSNALLLSLPIFLCAMGIGIFGALFIKKGKRYNYIFYLIAAIAQTIMIVMWMREITHGGRFTEYLILTLLSNVLSALLIIPGAILGTSRKRYAPIVFLVIILSVGGGFLSGLFNDRTYYIKNDYFEGMAAIYRGNILVRKWGFINEAGEEVIPPQYEEALRFSDGLAAVNNGKWGFIDRDGNEIVPLQYDSLLISDELLNPPEPVARVASITSIASTPGVAGAASVADIVTENGRQVELEQVDDTDRFNYFPEGLTAVSKDGKWGFIDKDGNETISLQFDSTRNFSGGFSAVCIRYKWGFIDVQGNEIIPIQYNSLGEFSEGKVSFCDNYGKFGYLDRLGNIIVPPQFDSASAFSNGYADVGITRSKYMGNWRINSGLINVDGDIVVQCKYYSISNLDGDLFVVSIRQIKSNRSGSLTTLYGVVSIIDGEEILPCIHRQLVMDNGLIKVQTENGEYHYFDRSGNSVEPPVEPAS